MDKKKIFGSIAVISFLGILFTEQNTNQWLSFFFVGLVFIGLFRFGK